MLLPAVRLRHCNESRQEAEESNRCSRRQPADQSPSALRGAGQRWRQRGQGHCVCNLERFSNYF